MSPSIVSFINRKNDNQFFIIGFSFVILTILLKHWIKTTIFKIKSVKLDHNKVLL